MKLKKCQKRGSRNIVFITISPEYDDDFCEKYYECKDCGFSMKVKKQEEIERKWEEKDLW